MKKIFFLFVLCIIFVTLYGCELNPTSNKISMGEEVENAYQKANDIIIMFWGTGMPIDESDKYTDEYNNVYYAVKYESISSSEDLRQYLNSIFSEQIIDELMDIGSSYRKRFLEIDNKLYQNFNDFSVSVLYYDIIEEKSNVNKISDKKLIYSIDKSLREKNKSDSSSKMYKFNYVYESVENEWIFTEFPVIQPFTEFDFDYSNYSSEYPIIIDIGNPLVVEQMYYQAQEAKSWFTTYADISRESTCSVRVGDNTYSRVYSDRFKTLKDMDNYLRTLFSDKIVGDLLASKTFISIDGQLYASESAGGFNALKVKDTHIEKISDSKYGYYVDLIETFPDDTDEGKTVYTIQYPYEYVYDHWVFTDFPSFRNVLRNDF